MGSLTRYWTASLPSPEMLCFSSSSSAEKQAQCVLSEKKQKSSPANKAKIKMQLEAYQFSKLHGLTPRKIGNCPISNLKSTFSWLLTLPTRRPICPPKDIENWEKKKHFLSTLRISSGKMGSLWNNSRTRVRVHVDPPIPIWCKCNRQENHTAGRDPCERSGVSFAW